MPLTRVSPPPQAVFFDVDGVLLDSLAAHLSYCADKAREYGLSGITVPDETSFRLQVSEGMRISPMLAFFRALGFDDASAQRGAADYGREFRVRHHPLPFAGVGAMLQRLREAPVPLGLVTSNTRANVERALGPLLHHFVPECCLYVDSFPVERSKDWCLQEGARRLGVLPAHCVYVGDQPNDARAAQKAGMGFLGVSYGWGLVTGQNDLPLVSCVEDIAPALLPFG